MNTAVIDSRNTRVQSVGSIVNEQTKRNYAELSRKLYNIDINNVAAKQRYDHRLEEAIKCIDNVRDFTAHPEKILGSSKTKHGEIAEQTDVWFQNAWNSMKGRSQPATFDGVPRTAPEDYLVRGIKVQSKYIDGSSKSLDAVLKHLDKYVNIEFGRDGSYYVIPKDFYEQIQRVLSGDTSGIDSRTVKAIQQKVQQIEEKTKKAFSEAVKPGQVGYLDVKLENIDKTLNREVNSLEHYAEGRKDATDRKSEKQRTQVKKEAAPSWKKANMAAAVGAGVGGTMQLSIGIYRKCKTGKKLSEFTVDDWKEIGVNTAKATIEGGISGYAIYGMSNFLHIPDPMAAAGASLALGLTELIYEYGKGTLSPKAFAENCQVLTINAAVCALGSHLGEMLIPVPILGSVIGSVIASNIFPEICGEGAVAAVENAAYYVHGATMSALKAVAEISEHQEQIAHNTKTVTQTQKKATQRIDKNFEEIEGLL